MPHEAGQAATQADGLPRLRKANFWILIGITILALPIYALLMLVLLFCDAPGAWCQADANINLIYIFGVILPFAIWFGLLVGALRKRPWRAAVWAGAFLLVLMTGAAIWLAVLAGVS